MITAQRTRAKNIFAIGFANGITLRKLNDDAKTYTEMIILMDDEGSAKELICLLDEYTNAVIMDARVQD